MNNTATPTQFADVTLDHTTAQILANALRDQIRTLRADRGPRRHESQMTADQLEATLETTRAAIHAARRAR